MLRVRGAAFMKVCAHCGAVYRDHVEFCFGDGEVLLTAPLGAPLEVSGADGLDPRVDAQTFELMKRVEEAVLASVTAARQRQLPAPIRQKPAPKPAPRSTFWRLILLGGLS
jgi:hypothetical protein